MEPTVVTAVSIPTIPNAKQAQVAVSAQGNIHVTFGVGDCVYFVVSTNGGTSYSPPVLVAQTGRFSLGMRRGPRIAVAGRTVVIFAVYGQAGRGADGDLLAWRSADNGKTWRGFSRVNDVAGAAREGLHAMTASPNGAIACTWLDLRSRRTQIFASVSRDGGARWGRNALVYKSPDGSVCECCHPSASFDPRGRLTIMWRNALARARDMYFVRCAEDGSPVGTAKKLGTSVWNLEACPMDGGAFGFTADNRVSAFWRRERTMYASMEGATETSIGLGEQGVAVVGRNGTFHAWLRRRPGALLLKYGKSRILESAQNADDPSIAALRRRCD